MYKLIEEKINQIFYLPVGQLKEIQPKMKFMIQIILYFLHLAASRTRHRTLMDKMTHGDRWI